MKAIYKRDFKSFFTSPIGYVLIGGFLFVMNLFFYAYNIKYAYSDLSSLFSIMVTILMFMVPLLTMKLFSEEYKIKTDQLLLTSPVSVGAVVTGKFFAAMSVFAVGLCGTLFWPVIIAMYGTVDKASVVGSYVAILFVAAAFVSIGLFISSLTENQIIAAFLSFAVFLTINLLGTISSATAYDWLKTILSWLSLFTRFSDFTQGLFALDNIIYYLTITVVFLFLTARVLEKKRWS